MLADLGFIAPDDAAGLGGRRRYGRGGGGGGGGEGGYAAWMSRPVNRNAANSRFLKAAICAGFYPEMLRVQARLGALFCFWGGALVALGRLLFLARQLVRSFAR